MAFDLLLFGTKLSRCRQQLQLSVSEVSALTGIADERLVSLEGGKIEPTGDEVLIFADVFKQNYQFFISNQQKAASEEVDILYRKFGDDFTKADRWAISEFLFLCECEDFVFKQSGLSAKSFHFQPTGDFFKGHGEEGAKALRRSLGYNDTSIVHDPYQTFRSLGLHIFRRKLINSNISGLFINHPTAGRCILVNYNEDIYRQNFTLAHEVGHAIFDYRENVNISFEKWDSTDLREVRANTFASNFLIPKGIFTELHAQNWTEGHLLQIAQQLKVNTQPLLIAMKSAGIISQGKYTQLQNVKVPMLQKTDPELKEISDNFLQAKKRVLEKGLSTYYVQLVFDGYKKGILSAGRLAEMLLCSENELVAILTLFNFHLDYEH